MNKIFSCSSLILIILFLRLSPLIAQSYQWAKEVNSADSGQITAQAVSPYGDIYIASYKNDISSNMNFGLNAHYPYGELVLSKLDSSGSQVWTKTFASSKARIFELKLDANNDIIFSGGYYDSLILSPQAKYAGGSFSSSSFIAKFDPNGIHIWSKAIPTVNYISFVSYTFESSDTVIVESGYFGGFTSSVRILNSNGDSISSLQFSSQVRIVSDIEIDSIGNIYIAGGAFSAGLIDTIPIPDPPSNSSYTNFIAKLNSNLNALWVRSTGHITLDESSQIELFSGQIAFLSNDYPLGFGNPNSFRLKYYDPSGNLLNTDSVTNAYFSHSNGRLGLSSTKNHLLLTLPVGDTLLQLKRINSNYQDTIFTTIKCQTFDNFPDYGISDNALFFTSSFYTPMAIVNTVDTIFNAAGGSLYNAGFRQFLVKFNLGTCIPINSNLTVNQCGVYTSPSGNYSWSQSGTYYDTITNPIGCDSIFVINLIVNNVDTTVTIVGSTLIANVPNASYQWLDCNGYSPISGSTNQSFTPLSNGNYAVEITKNNCIDTSACYSITTVGFNKDFFGNSYYIYPNPTSGKITVDLGSNLDGIVTVRNILGQEVTTQNFSETRLLNFDIVNTKGIYFVEIRITENIPVINKVLKI
ncbi:T9SS type A sorting domain-containing protein [Bacteroidota bacterium]